SVVRKAALDRLEQSSVMTFAMRQVERNAGLTQHSKNTLRAIWVESIEVAARCHVIAREYTKLNANEALLTGLLSVVGRLYIMLKSIERGLADDAELEQVLADWHPTISKAIAESWNMSESLITAMELQLESDPPLQEDATLAEVLCAAKILLQAETASEPVSGADYPLLQRLGIAGHGDSEVSLAAHTEALDTVRQGLRA
ncbi:MAG: HDOD domain-containing protein, partial [Pseudomonadota bacterium]